MSTVVNVLLNDIEPNEYRDLGTYPVLREKIDALKASIAAVGMWPSIVIRKSKRHTGKFEQAFGHSRGIAASELGIKEVPAILMDLTDEQMVQYMGRENGEDYGTDVQVLLNTWEAADTFLSRTRKSHTHIQTARLLGWMEADGEHMSMPARTCSNAMRLIEDGHMTRSDLAGIPVSAAFNVVERVVSRMEAVDKRAKVTGQTPHQREQIKKHIAQGGRQTVKEVRDGTVAARDVRNKVDANTYGSAKGTKSELPLFRAFGKVLTDSIYRTLRNDAMAEKLEQVVDALPQITADDDKDLVRQIGFDLEELEGRSKRWRSKLAAKPAVKLAELEGRRA